VRRTLGRTSTTEACAISASEQPERERHAEHFGDRRELAITVATGEVLRRQVGRDIDEVRERRDVRELEPEPGQLAV
jgi:hypothetical protein